jgi:hypothetical protein
LQPREEIAVIGEISGQLTMTNGQWPMNDPTTESPHAEKSSRIVIVHRKTSIVYQFKCEPKSFKLQN